MTHAELAPIVIAALLLERSSVPKSKAARFSIARVTNNGPLGIVGLILSSRNSKSIATIESFLLLLLLVETTGLQFSSTILLSDLQDSAIISNKGVVQLNTLVSSNQQKITVNEHFYRVMGPEFPVFGEWSSNNTKVPQGTGLSETGIISRAFLPFSQAQERIATRFYEGGAAVLNSSTTCMRPDIESFQFAIFTWATDQENYFCELNATLDYGLSIQNAEGNESYVLQRHSAIPFTCAIPGRFDGYGWQSTMCFVGGVGGTLWPPSEGPKAARVDEPWSTNSSIYLVFATNMRTSDWALADETGAMNNGSLFSPATSDYGEWRSYQLLPDRFLNASLCFQAYNLVYSYVQMEAMAPLMEPSITYDRVSGGINTASVQRYFGASSEWSPPGQREVLQISQQSNPPPSATKDSQEYTMNKLGGRVYDELVSSPYANYSILACYHCISGYSFALHPDTSAILGNILNSTSRAVDLLQTYVTSIVTILYLDNVRKFTVPEDVTLSSMQTVVTAHGCRDRGGCSGFISVVTLLAIHLSITLAITTRYLVRTRYSRHSSVWYAVAQLLSKELQDVTENCSCSSDKDVERAMKQEGNDELVKVGRVPNSRRVEILKH